MFRKHPFGKFPQRNKRFSPKREISLSTLPELSLVPDSPIGGCPIESQSGYAQVKLGPQPKIAAWRFERD